MENNSKVLRLFESCILTIGASRSAILDMQRDIYYLVPNSLAMLFNDKHVFTPDTVENTEENNLIINEYIDFLLTNELCFYCEKSLLDNFPLLNMDQWDYPAHITNAVIEIDFYKPEPSIRTIRELTNTYLTRHFEIHAAGVVNKETVENVLRQVDTLDLYSYNLVIAFLPEELEEGIRLLQEHYKIFRSTVHSAGRNDIILSDKAGWGNVFLQSETYNNNQCGIVNTHYFVNNIEHITESHNHNTCLNRKIAIDKDGNIKNCPGMCHSQGNINTININDVITDPAFTKYWSVKKDEIAVCKDCEFRHICTDCRAFTEDPGDLYSKPLKCGYDPYTNEWQEWSTLPFKQKAIEFYGMNSIAETQNHA